MSRDSEAAHIGLREHFSVLGRAKPGHRFVLYHDWRAERIRRRWVRPLYLLLSILLIPVGLIMLVTPGPGLLVLFVGLGLVAQASRRWAGWLDRSEHWCRKRFAGRSTP